MITRLSHKYRRPTHWRSSRRKPAYVDAMLQTEVEQSERHIGRNALIVVGGVVVVGGVLLAVSGSGWVTLLSKDIILSAQASPYTIPIYITSATLLPLFFVPQTIFISAAGVLFGFGLGMTLALGTQVASSLLGYTLGSQLSKKTSKGHTFSPRINAYTERLRAYPLESVTLMRLIYLPHEVVSYACGWLQIDRGAFSVGTAVGTLPATLFIVSLGSSVSSFALAGATTFQPVLLIISGGIFVGTLVLARRQRSGQIEETVEVIEMSPIEDLQLMAG